jgi:hypothetical protein
MNSETTQPDEPQPKGLIGRLLSSVKGLAALVTAIGTLFGASALALNYWNDQRAKTPQAEYERLAKLRAGITLSRFQEILEEDEAHVQRSGSSGFKRHIFGRPYDYVLAVTDKNQTVVSFSVMVRKDGFYPTFGDGDIVLGQKTLAAAWDTPGALAGVCGKDVAYFERTELSSADPVVRAVGIYARGHADEKDLELLCNAERQLYRCDGYLAGEADLSSEAVGCFPSTAEGKQLRQNLRPNIYAEGALYQELPIELLTPSEPEIIAAEG